MYLCVGSHIPVCGFTCSCVWAAFQYFWVLVLMRALVGTGEASYSTIAPTIIGDMFSGGRRTIAISLFYVVLPVGR